MIYMHPFNPPNQASAAAVIREEEKEEEKEDYLMSNRRVPLIVEEVRAAPIIVHKPLIDLSTLGHSARNFLAKNSILAKIEAD